MAEILQRLYKQETEGGSDSGSEEGEGEEEGALSVETLHRLLAKVGRGEGWEGVAAGVLCSAACING